MGIILHIANRAAWDEARSIGNYAAASLYAEGFLHCSTIRQVLDTANRFFPHQSGLVLLCIDERRTHAEVRYEAPTGDPGPDPAVGALFPHVYGALNLDAVIRVVDFPPGADGTFSLPSEIIDLATGT